MKHVRGLMLATTIILLVGSGCTTVLEVKPVQSYSLHETHSATVGNPFLTDQKGTKKQVKYWVGVLRSPDGWKIEDVYSLDYLRRELIYSGISGNTIEVAYREYRGGLAAPAFFQNIKYDLSASAIVRFQNFTIEVLSADNNSITCKILSDT
jgi:hypothetical protein